MFYDYCQNNSHGKVIMNDSVGQYVIIEADSAYQANKMAKNIGIYFNGCEENRDCNCCGDRWMEKINDNQGTETPTLYGQTIEEYENCLDFAPLNDKTDVHTYYKNGKHEVYIIDNKKVVEKNKKNKREKADKIWGTAFNLYGLWGKNPYRLYQGSGKKFWDKTGNFSIEKCGFNLKGPDYMEFGSTDKKDVEHFIDGAQSALNGAIMAVETWKTQNEPQAPTPYQNGVEAVLAHLKMILR